MRRYWVIALAVLTLLGVLSPPAFAQAPTPVVTISGLLQHATTVGRNMFDGNFTRAGDREWASNLRARPDITAQVGNVKMVLGFEFDLSYGQVGPADTSLVTSSGTNGGTAAASGAGNGAVQLGGMTGGLDINTDVLGVIELKWAYTEFPFTGAGSLLPFIPVPTVARIGAQPFATTYKGAVLASGDFAGANFVTTWTPQIKSHLALVQVEEQGNGTQFTNVGTTPATVPGRCNNANTPVTGTAALGQAACRGNDWALILGVEVTPMKGLDIRPIYAYYNSYGSTHANARQALSTTIQPGALLQDEERRHTIGFDARWTWGNLFIDPTYFYQFGDRETRGTLSPVGSGLISGVASASTTADISAHLIDIRGGYRMGPLLLEAMVGYVSGNKARDNLAKEIRYYQPIDTDSGYYATWASILALNVDSTAVGAQNGLGANMGYFQYGRVQTGYRATYSWTPALDTSVSISPTWTARSVDTDTFAMTRQKTCVGNGLSGISCEYKGDSSYIGTEANLGLVWRFAPNTRFDLVGAWLFAGSALDGAEIINSQNGMTGRRKDSVDAWGISSKITFNY